MVLLLRGGATPDGRGWAGDVNDDVEGAQAHGLVLGLLAGRGTGRVESCGAQEIRVECKLVSAIATAALLGGREAR
jgi:hypothetical protein